MPLDGLVIASQRRQLVIEDEQRRTRRARIPKRLGQIFCGDHVHYHLNEQGEVVIDACLPRRSLLSRLDARGRQRPLCANIDQLIIVADASTRQGELHLNLLDRYLVSAELNRLDALIVINKVDGCDGLARERLARTLAPYRDMGYHCHLVSAHNGEGVEGLLADMHDRRSCFVGESGVGKSSLINRLVPGHDVQVGELSSKGGFGKHTTSTTLLYHLPGSGEIIDSPGVRSFALGDIDSARLAEGFREFRPLIGHCRFRNCRHDDDSGCAIASAVAAGRIAAPRYASYRQILADSLARQ